VSRWGETVTETTEEAKRFWAGADLSVLYGMMDTPRWAWIEWLRVAAGVITSPGTVWEPGCGIGTLAEVLPEGCSYYGCDLNAGYVEEARRRYPQGRFDARDLDDVLDSDERFDWVVVSSLFGMFPEEACYELLPRFWAHASKGLSLTTVNARMFPRSRRLAQEFTAHDPDRLMEVELPGARKELHHGREYERFHGHHWSRGLVLYAWRDEGSTSAP
jgi:Methyltransferase domain